MPNTEMEIEKERCSYALQDHRIGKFLNASNPRQEG